MKPRPSMVRRPHGEPASSPEEERRALDHMKATLQGHAHRIQTHRDAVMNSPESGAEGSEVRDRTMSQRRLSATPSLQEQQEALGAMTGPHPPYVDPQGPAPPVEALTQRPIVPASYKAEPAKLEWLAPVAHPNGEKTQVSTGGQYAVLGRRTPEGFVFIARHGLNALGASKESAENARAMCQRHYEKACIG